MFTRLIPVALAVTLTLGAHAAPDLDAAKSSNALGFNLMKKLEKKTAKGNRFVSPVSLYMTLAMLQNGSQKETAEEIAHVLSASGVSREEMNASSSALID